MKVNLIISPVFPPEPVVSAKLSFDIANAIASKEPVIVISQKPSRPYGFKFNRTNPKYNFLHIHSNSFISPKPNLLGRFIESYSFGRYCCRYISKNHENIKVIYANTWPLIAQFITAYAAKKFTIPLIVHIQDIYPESLTNKMPIFRYLLNLFLMPIDRYVLRNANKVIAISEKMKMHLTKTRKISSDKIIVVRNWQDEEIFMKYGRENKLEKSKPNLFTFMYLGNIGAVAGVELLIDAFTGAELSGSRLVIAGSGPLKEPLQKKVSDTKQVNIEFWPVPDGKVPEIQSMADVLLLPVKKGTASSSIPSKLSAYMFSKKPIIASVDVDSDSAVCINEADCGFVIEPGNVKQLSYCMKEMRMLPAERMREMGQNGFDFACRNMSKSANLEKIISVINGI